MKVSIHQPPFLPWAGWWHKALSSDLHVLYTGVQYEHRGVQRRVKIKGQWVSLSVLSGSRELLKYTMVDPRTVRKAADQIRIALKAEPYYGRVEPIVRHMAGWVSASAFTALRNWMSCSAFAVGMSSRCGRSMYFWLISPSIVSARVAGVPSPRSFIASASSSAPATPCTRCSRCSAGSPRATCLS